MIEDIRSDKQEKNKRKTEKNVAGFIGFIVIILKGRAQHEY